MKSLRWITGFALLILLAGCATGNGHLPEHALKDPAQGISIPHPVEAEKAGVKAFTTFTVIMNSDLWTEVVAAGGVFPVLGQADDGSVFKGYGYLASVNWWGDFLLQCVFAYGKGELKDAKSAVFNRDAGWAYKLDGREEEYDPEKFENDQEYRKDFFQISGMTLSQLDESWKNYFYGQGLKPAHNLTSVQEIAVGTPEWEAYKARLAAQMPNNYKMADGQIRIGHLEREDFTMAAVEDPGFTGGARFVKDLKVPLLVLPLAGLAWPIAAGTSVVSSAVAASVDDSWSGFYGRAKIIRHDMAPAFRQIVAIYKELLKRRDERIGELERQIKDLSLRSR